MRIGHGYDVHRFAEDRALILGGVNIAYDLGMLGHSDADVLLHAVMDALLGAAGLRDIGYHFPDTDPKYKGADSLALLGCVAAKIAEKGYSLGNLDVTIIAQAPKLAPHIPQMRENIAKALNEKGVEYTDYLETDEEVETLKKIYERLQAMKCLNNFYIRNLENGNCEKRRGSVTIIQLSNLPKEEKKFMTIMIIELLWKEMKLADTKRHFDLLILDEFQHISRHASNTLKELFCQGRKKGLNVLLSTQFLTQYDSEDINSFCQNGGIVAFKPASKEDLLFSTKLIINYFAFDGDMKKWTNILKTLETGVGIYAGKYCINGKKKVYTEPFRCIVDEKIKDSK